MFRFTVLIVAILTTVCLLGACSSPQPAASEPVRARPTRLATATPSPGPADTARSIADDYFRGADCYGDRVAGCLGVNEELDIRAASPALCQGAEARVCLVPVGNVRTDVVDAIVRFHKDSKGLDIRRVSFHRDALNDDLSGYLPGL